MTTQTFTQKEVRRLLDVVDVAQLVMPTSEPQSQAFRNLLSQIREALQPIRRKGGELTLTIEQWTALRYLWHCAVQGVQFRKQRTGQQSRLHGQEMNSITEKLLATGPAPAVLQ